MGYRIAYNPEDDHKYPGNIPKKKKIRLLPVVTCLVLFLALGRPQIRKELEKWLIPGDPNVTKAAFDLMLDELRQGGSFADAVTTFCGEIIAGSEIKNLSWT